MPRTARIAPGGMGDGAESGPEKGTHPVSLTTAMLPYWTVRPNDLRPLFLPPLNSDAGVRRLKGPARPIIGQNERAALLCALSAVDYVVLFDDETPEMLIHALRPDVLVKGREYRDHDIPGHQFVISLGGCVVLVDPVEGRSTTNTIERVVESIVRTTESPFLPK